VVSRADLEKSTNLRQELQKRERQIAGLRTANSGMKQALDKTKQVAANKEQAGVSMQLVCA
jgi:hypothetical protein